uniref:U3 small nucleolar RNA-associated protein 11 n=1 Tax=Skeletonema marinoi TaxID=267567 RepID=A0A7S2KRK9_9STRA|mmetsp:Transcript_16019/g.27056  ORF Transcript_16019/g.27056 Transcript_16019/m.27056 type:complete len:341 (+) Transcript_16019:226-1248(+)
MSSLRNAVKRITHKERSQPQSRSHLGLLEKKGDYRQRSRDYHRKQDRLKSMRDKIANKNPDEFYFGMHSSRVDNYGLRKGGSSGRHVKTDEARQKELEEKGLGADAVRIMKDQDLAYVRMQRVMDGKKVERLQSSLHYLEGNHRQYNRDDNDGHVDNSEDDEEESGALLKMVAKKRKHTVFVDGGQSAVDNFDAARHFDTIPELVARSFNRPRVKELEREAMRRLGGKVAVRDADDDYYDDDDDVDNFDEEGNPKQVQLTEKQLVKQERNQMKLEKRIAKSRSAAYSEMELRNERMKKLQNAEAHLIVEKQTRMKGRKRKIAGKEDGKPAVYKWRRKRAK